MFFELPWATKNSLASRIWLPGLEFGTGRAGPGVCDSQVPGIQVMVEEQSSTIFTAGAPAVIGGTVTNDT